MIYFSLKFGQFVLVILDVVGVTPGVVKICGVACTTWLCHCIILQTIIIIILFLYRLNKKNVVKLNKMFIFFLL